MKAPEGIVFHHIPKCGGMSITAGLALSYYPFRLLRYGRAGFPGHLNARAASQAAEALSMDHYAYRRALLEYQLASDNSPFISGHYPFSRGGFERYGDQWAFISLFRDPVSRWYSEYFWNRYKDHEYAKTELDMEAYLETEQGRMNTRSFLNYFCESKNPAGAPANTELKEALTNIECLDVTGTLENIEQFRESMKRRFGRKPVFFQRNRSPAKPETYIRPDPQSDFHKKLLILLEADREIYAHVLKTTDAH